MTLADLFRSTGITLFASLAADVPPVINPRLLRQIPAAQSVVFAAIPYYVPGEPSNLAMFARSRDYHLFARYLSERCAAHLSARCPGCASAGFSDHSPYKETVGAALAGLGVLGDNGLLITERYSSYVFLFALVTTLSQSKLEEEGIPRGAGVLRECPHCGACSAACPGRCCPGDKSGCLSAITQKKGELTPEESAQLAAAPYAWGCDVCQEACPFTEAARLAGTLESTVPFFLENRLTLLRSEDIENMPDEQYTSYAFGWRKKEVILRNLRIRGDV